MPGFRRYLRILLIVVAVVQTLTLSVAHSDDLEIDKPCLGLSLDGRYEELRAAAKNDRELKVGLTHLLSESFTPFLKIIHDQVLQIPDRMIWEEALRVKIDRGRPEIKYATDGSGKEFEWAFSCKSEKTTHSVSVTDFNSQSMRQLVHAICVMNNLLIKAGLPEGAVQGAETLLSERTFAQQDLLFHLKLGFESLLQSATLLTSEPVLDLTSDQILRIGSTQIQSRPSLIVMHSIMLPPAHLGRTGHQSYISNAIVSDGRGGLTFSPEYKDYIKEKRVLFIAKHHQAFELGHGCPVGHCLPGEARPGLQYFVDAILYIYGVMEQRIYPKPWSKALTPAH